MDLSAVRVEIKALSDPRFIVFGEILGVGVHSALGKMIHVWLVCTDRQVYSLSPREIDAMCGAGAAAAMVESGLGDESSGSVRVKGLSGRIEWLSRLRDGNSNGGRIRAAASSRLKDGRFKCAESQDPSSSPPGPLQRTQPAHSSALTLTLTPTLSTTESEGASRPAGRVASTQRRTKASILDKHKASAESLWGKQEAFRKASIPGSRFLKATPDGLTRIAERLESGATPEDCEHVLRVYAAESGKNPGNAKWFNGQTNWRPDNFARALGQPLPAVEYDPSAEIIRLSHERQAREDREAAGRRPLTAAEVAEQYRVEREERNRKIAEEAPEREKDQAAEASRREELTKDWDW